MDLLVEVRHFSKYLNGILLIGSRKLRNFLFSTHVTCKIVIAGITSLIGRFAHTWSICPHENSLTVAFHFFLKLFIWENFSLSTLRRIFKCEGNNFNMGDFAKGEFLYERIDLHSVSHLYSPFSGALKKPLILEP